MEQLTEEFSTGWVKPDIEKLNDVIAIASKILETGLNKDLEAVQKVKELYELRAKLANALDKK